MSSKITVKSLTRQDKIRANRQRVKRCLSEKYRLNYISAAHGEKLETLRSVLGDKTKNGKVSVVAALEHAIESAHTQQQLLASPPAQDGRILSVEMRRQLAALFGEHIKQGLDGAELPMPQEHFSRAIELLTAGCAWEIEVDPDSWVWECGSIKEFMDNL